MPVNGYSTYAAYLSNVNGFQRLQTSLATLTQQLNSGKKSTDLTTYGVEAQRLVDLRAEIARRQGYIEAIKSAATDVKAYDRVFDQHRGHQRHDAAGLHRAQHRSADQAAAHGHLHRRPRRHRRRLQGGGRRHAVQLRHQRHRGQLRRDRRQSRRADQQFHRRRARDRAGRRRAAGDHRHRAGAAVQRQRHDHQHPRRRREHHRILADPRRQGLADRAPGRDRADRAQRPAERAGERPLPVRRHQRQRAGAGGRSEAPARSQRLREHRRQQHHVPARRRHDPPGRAHHHRPAGHRPDRDAHGQRQRPSSSTAR